MLLKIIILTVTFKDHNLLLATEETTATPEFTTPLVYCSEECTCEIDCNDNQDDCFTAPPCEKACKCRDNEIKVNGKCASKKKDVPGACYVPPTTTVSLHAQKYMF